MTLLALVMVVSCIANILFVFFMFDIFNRPSREEYRHKLCDFFASLFVLVLTIDKSIKDTPTLMNCIQIALYYMSTSLLTYNTLGSFFSNGRSKSDTDSYGIIIIILCIIASVFALVLAIDKELDISVLPLKSTDTVFLTFNYILIIIPGFLSLPVYIAYMGRFNKQFTFSQSMIVLRAFVSALIIAAMYLVDELIYNWLLVILVIVNSLSIIGIFRLNDNTLRRNRYIGSILLIDDYRQVHHKAYRRD